MRQLDMCAPDVVHGADRRGEVVEGATAGPAQEDVAEHFRLAVVTSPVDLKADAPWRSGLVVVVPAGHHDGQVVENGVVRAAVEDLPRQCELADAMGRTATVPDRLAGCNT